MIRRAATVLMYFSVGPLLLLAGYIVGSLVCLTVWAAMPAAPVPPPLKLTPDLLAGTWGYSWGSWPNGIIAFNADGSYSAQHEPGSNTAYAGTWKLEGNVVTITEYSFTVSTGERGGGPVDYKFDFGKTTYPNLSGVSNGSTKVAISNPKR